MENYYEKYLQEFDLSREIRMLRQLYKEYEKHIMKQIDTKKSEDSESLLENES